MIRWLTCVAILAACGATRYDVVIRGGTIYDGGGGSPTIGDVAVTGDRIAALGPAVSGRGRVEIDARGHAVSPGFIGSDAEAPAPEGCS